MYNLPSRMLVACVGFVDLLFFDLFIAMMMMMMSKHMIHPNIPPMIATSSKIMLLWLFPGNVLVNDCVVVWINVVVDRTMSCVTGMTFPPSTIV